MKSIFDDIITSKVGVKVLELFFSNLTEMYHDRGIVREIREEINAVRRELERLEKAGILKKEPRGNRIYYFVRTDYGGFSDLLSIVAKSTGLGKEICDSRAKLGKVSIVMGFFFGSLGVCNSFIVIVTASFLYWSFPGIKNYGLTF